MRLTQEAKKLDQRKGTRWFYEFNDFVKRYDDIHHNLYYQGFQFFNFKDGKYHQFLGGVFQLSAETKITEDFLRALNKLSTKNIAFARYFDTLEMYGKKCIVVILN